MKKFLLIISLALGVVAVPIALSPSASAANPFGPCANSSNSGNTACKAKTQSNTSSLVHNIINLLLMIAGVVAVVMIIIGGIRYTTSSGDSNSAKSAMNTLLYSVIGLVIAIFAYAMVQYVYDFFF